MEHPLFAFFRRSRLARVVFAVFAVATGCGCIFLSYDNARRAALGEALLDTEKVEGLGRRQVRCAHPIWHCEEAVLDDADGFVVPFDCGAASGLSAGFPRRENTCDPKRASVAGFLIDLNEAGGGAPRWMLRVDAPPATFPDLVAYLGLGIIALGLAFPAMVALLARRNR